MRRRVLIVDDALFMRTMIREILLSTGRYEIVGEATSGEEAVEMFGRLVPDLVTMDVVMPGAGGIEATRRILAADPEATVVMCSALGQEAMVMESIAAGAKDFIVKPFTPERVIKVLDSVGPRGGD